MEEKKIPHYINDPVINRLTAPENRLYRPQINYCKAGLTVVCVIGATVVLSFLISSFFRSSNTFGMGNKDQWQAF